MPSSGSGSMAFLVFLAAAAGTGIVPPDLRLLAAHGLDRGIVAADTRWLLRTRRARRGSGAGRQRPRRAEHRRRGGLGARIVEDERRAALRLAPRCRDRRPLALENGPQPPQVADDLLVDPLLHRLEQLEAFLLVLDEGIALAVAAQADAFLQVIEGVEMILPLLIDDLQHDVALDALQDLAADER